MKEIKLFETMDMPQEIFEIVALDCANDSYRNWHLHDKHHDESFKKEFNLVHKWLLENGLHDAPYEEYEYVLIFVSW